MDEYQEKSKEQGGRRRGMKVDERSKTGPKWPLNAYQKEGGRKSTDIDGGGRAETNRQESGVKLT